MPDQITAPEYSVTLVSTAEDMTAFQAAMMDISLIALDIETAYWWDKSAEKVALIQIAVPTAQGIQVWVIDCLAKLDLWPIQQITINTNILKVIHNANFDVLKLKRLANIVVEKVFDTMLAGKRAGEKGCSLEKMAARHLNIVMDKNLQRSNWAIRPLTAAQLTYAALDAVLTLHLYNKLANLGFNGDYQKRLGHSLHEERPQVTIFEQPVRAASEPILPNEQAEQALIQVVMQFPGRYNPQTLANCLNRDRSGLAGYLVDAALTTEAFVEYQTALAMVNKLLTESKLVSRGRNLSVNKEAFIKQ